MTDAGVSPRRDCDWSGWSRDPQGCLPFRAFMTLDECRPHVGDCFVMGVTEPTPAPEPEPIRPPAPRRKKALAEVPAPVLASSHTTGSEHEKATVMADGPLLDSPLVDAPPPSPIAMVGVAENAIDDVAKLIPAGGDAGIVTVMLAAVGVAGGGAAWKFYTQSSKNKHEQAMRRLEIEAARADSRQADEQNHQKCTAERVLLEQKIAALEARLAESEKKTSSLSLGGFDPDELMERLEKLEKKAAPRSRAKKA